MVNQIMRFAIARHLIIYLFPLRIQVLFTMMRLQKVGK